MPSATVESVNNEEFNALKRQASIIKTNTPALITSAPTNPTAAENVGSLTGRKIIVDEDEPAEPKLLQPQQPEPQKRKGLLGGMFSGNKKLQQIKQAAKQR